MSTTSSPPTEHGQADEHATKIRILGVGGGIGSGKSTACKILAEDLGCIAYIDADAVAHTIYQPGSQCLKEIAEQFGSDVIQENGEMDRKKLGSIVFADRKEMFKLEAIVWPTTKKAVLDKIEVIKTDKPKCEYPVVVVEAAMLLDADWHEFLDGLWIVTAPPDSALQRLVNTRDMTEEDAQQRLNAQLPRRGVGNLADEVEAGRVSAVIENNGGLQELREALKAKLSDPKAWY